MQKLMSKKKIIICICAVAVVIAAAAVILFSNKEEAYRSILVYELDGTAVIEREGVGSMNAAENLYLESGDHVIVAQNSSMRMKLDDDKYVMAEADTIFTVEAQGTNENSKTKICLEQGAVTNEIQHPLSDGASYETSTPNSVMAVRGTIYRVELYIDDNGEQNTKMCCFQGKVATTPIVSGGNTDKEVLVPAGSELIIHSDGTADSPREIVYEELPEQAVQNLKSLLGSGQSMEGITLEEVDKLLGQSEDTSEVSENNEPEQAEVTDAEENTGQSDTDVDKDSDKDVDVAENASEKTAVKEKESVKSQITTQPEAEPRTAAQPEVILQTADMTTVQPKQELQTSDNARPAVSEPTNNDNSGKDNTQGGNSGGGSVNNDGSDNNKPDNNKPDNNKPDNNNPGDDTPVTPPPAVTYTVTFEYDGKTFATQTVKSGGKASEPLLVPSQIGEWDFDFETAIEADTTIKWK